MSCANRDNNNNDNYTLGSPNLLPIDVLLLLTDFLELRDFPNLIAASKSLQNAFDQEVVYEHRARNTFPAQFLDISKYNNSWKALIRNGNGENGVYIRHIRHKYGSWRHNSPTRFYINSLRSIVWDRKNRQVLTTIEGFGNSDLRPADTSVITYISTTDKTENLLVPVGIKEWTHRPKEAIAHVPFLHNFTYVRVAIPQSRQHDLCQLVFDENDFLKSPTFIFTYSGNMTLFAQRGVRSDDYNSVVFLEQGEGKKGWTPSLTNIFDLKRNDCEFIPRDCDWMSPSNVSEWEVNLPPPIRTMHARGQWGTVSRRVPAPGAPSTATGDVVGGGDVATATVLDDRENNS